MPARCSETLHYQSLILKTISSILQEILAFEVLTKIQIMVFLWGFSREVYLVAFKTSTLQGVNTYITTII